MADAAQFDIRIDAEALGVDSSASQVSALADRITKVNSVATVFDKAVSAARARLEETATAAKAAAASLSTAETRYRELETAANKAAKEVEKASLAGNDTSALQAASTAAAAKMREQALAVDALRVKSDAAAKSQSKLAATLKTLESQQASAAAEIKKARTPINGTAEALDAIGAKGALDRIQKIGKGLTSVKGAGILAAAGLAAVAAVALTATLGLAAFAVASNHAAMAKLSMATARLTLGFKNLFSGLKLDGFVRGLEDIGTLFDKGTSSANGMKALVETIFQPLFDGAAKAAPFVKEMFKGLIHGALQVVIAVLTLRNGIFKAMSPETRAQIKNVVDGVFTLENAFKAGTATAIVLTAVMIGLAVAVIAATWPVLAVVAAVAAVIAIFMNWGAIVDWLTEMWDGFVDFIKKIPGAWVNAAKMMIDGLVKGLKDGAGAVVGAVKGLASSAINAFTGKDGIDAHSPSRVFHMRGVWSAEGYAEGVEDMIPDVEDAAISMAVAGTDATDSAGGSKASGSSPSSDARKVVNFNGPVTFADRSTWPEFAAFLTQAIEGVDVLLGGGAAPEAA